MERLLEFVIAKKLAKPEAAAAGLLLKRAASAPGSAVLNISTSGKEGNDRVRAAVADFRLRTACDISYIVRGKSVEVSLGGEDAAALAMDFASGLNFACEGSNEFLEFWQRLRTGEFGSGPELLKIEVDEGIFRILLARCVSDEVSDEDVYAAFAQALIEYDMGIVKGSSDV